MNVPADLSFDTSVSALQNYVWLKLKLAATITCTGVLRARFDVIYIAFSFTSNEIHVLHISITTGLRRDRVLHDSICIHLYNICCSHIKEPNMIVETRSLIEKNVNGKPRKLQTDCETMRRFMRRSKQME